MVPSFLVPGRLVAMLETELVLSSHEAVRIGEPRPP